MNPSPPTHAEAREQYVGILRRLPFIMFKRFLNHTNLLCLVGTLGASSAFAASFSVSGGYVFDVNMLSNYDLQGGTLAGYGNTASYWGNRFILRPDVLVDDRFTIRSELNMLHQMSDAAGPNIVSNATGTALDHSLSTDAGTQMLQVRKMYLEWASDWGLFKIGRQPKDWGLGILYNTGSTPTKVNDTIVDRVGFEGMVGNLHLQLGFEKGQEGKLANDSDDVEGYEISVEYVNEENLFNVGLLYNRTVVSATADNAVYGTSANILGLYTKKQWGALSLGGEFVSQNSKGSAQAGALAKILYKPSAWALGVDAGYASANGSGNFTFQSNYKPLVILFNEYVGPKAGQQVRTGAEIGKAIGSGTGSGAVFGVLTAAYTFASGNYTLGTNFGYAQLAKKRSNANTALGTEVDLHLTQKWYTNFQTSYALGMLFPGKAFSSDAQVGWGTRITGALSF